MANYRLLLIEKSIILKFHFRTLRDTEVQETTKSPLVFLTLKTYIAFNVVC